MPSCTPVVLVFLAVPVPASRRGAAGVEGGGGAMPKISASRSGGKVGYVTSSSDIVIAGGAWSLD